MSPEPNGVLSPRQAFEDNIRPAELLLRVYRLFERDTDHTDEELLRSLRTLVGANAEEDLILVYNEIFLGLVRERAQITGATLRRASLNHLLRQSVVAACTALETYLPSLLRANLPTVIDARGRDFVPQDKDLQTYFKDLSFNLVDTLRLIGDPEAPLFIANKILGLTNFKFSAARKAYTRSAPSLRWKIPGSSSRLASAIIVKTSSRLSRGRPAGATTLSIGPTVRRGSQQERRRRLDTPGQRAPWTPLAMSVWPWTSWSRNA